MPLSEDQRLKLDTIVEKMIGNKETDDDIQWVVNDFKAKYSGVELPVGAPEAPGQEIGGAPIPEQGLEQRIRAGGEFSVEELIQTPEVQKRMEEIKGAGRTIANIPGSALETGKALGQAVIHPIETTKNIGKLLLGAVQKVIPGEQEYEKYADAFGKAMIERYGGMENLNKTIETDPVGFAMDAASLFTTAGAVLRGVGAVSKAGAITQVGKKMAEVGTKIDPLTLAGRAVKPVYAGVKRGVEEVTGLTTGAGRTVMQEAGRRAPEFVAARKGLVEARDIADEARMGIRDFAEKKATAYRQKLEAVRGIKKEIDAKPIKERIENSLKEYGIERSQKMEISRGGRATISESFDYSRAAGIPPNEEPYITKMLNIVDEWDDFTPAGLDTLKRKVDKFYSPSSESRALIAKIRDKIRQTLIDEVPGYEAMTKEYKFLADMQDDIVKALSLQDSKAADTVMRKMITGIKESSDLRRQLMDEIKGVSGRDIKAMIAGYMSKRVIPEGLIARMGMVGAAYGTILNPSMITLFGLASPAIVTSFLGGLGRVEKIAAAAAKGPLGKAPLRQAGFQAGRIGLMPEMEQ